MTSTANSSRSTSSEAKEEQATTKEGTICLSRARFISKQVQWPIYSLLFCTLPFKGHACLLLLYPKGSKGSAWGTEKQEAGAIKHYISKVVPCQGWPLASYECTWEVNPSSCPAPRNRPGKREMERKECGKSEKEQRNGEGKRSAQENGRPRDRQGRFFGFSGVSVRARTTTSSSFPF